MDKEILKGMEVELAALQDEMTNCDRTSEEYEALNEAYVEQLEKYAKFVQLEQSKIEFYAEDSRQKEELSLRKKELEVKKDELDLDERKTKASYIFQTVTSLASGALLIYFVKDSWAKEMGEMPLMQTTSVGRAIQSAKFNLLKFPRFKR